MTEKAEIVRVSSATVETVVAIWHIYFHNFPFLPVFPVKRATLFSLYYKKSSL